MLQIVIVMLLGLVSGRLCRPYRLKEFISRAVTPLIWLLLLLLGLEVGGDGRIVSSLPTLGLEALLLAVAGVVGSVAGAAVLLNGSGGFANRRAASQTDITIGTDITARQESGGLQNRRSRYEDAPPPLRGSLIIVGFFVVGALAGALVIPAEWSARLARGGMPTLLCLMYCVTFSVGSDPQTLGSFRSLRPRLLLLPVCTIGGTLAGVAALSLALPGRSAADCMAVGAGFAYYSLSSILITAAKGAALGTVALLANIARELITLLLAPLLARRFGPLAPITAGGATTMDTTLPVIASSSGPQYVPLAIYHGVVCDTSVPFLVTLFCSF